MTRTSYWKAGTIVIPETEKRTITFEHHLVTGSIDALCISYDTYWHLSSLYTISATRIEKAAVANMSVESFLNVLNQHIS